MAGNVASECSETTVEIQIKMMDSQTFTLRVDKCVPVPQLKEQIASLTGVVTEQQRLICRGKVLTDDQLLSAYHVEDGHTLHLVVRQPIVPTPEIFDHPESDAASSDGQNPHVMVGTFNLAEQGDGGFPDLNRLVSAVLGTFRLGRSIGRQVGIDLNLPQSASTAPDLSGTVPSDQATLPVDSLQLPIIPDSLTTLLQNLGHLRQEFLANAGGHSANAQNAGLSGSEGAAAVHSSEPRGLLRPESLAEVLSSARQLLVDQAAVCLSQLAGQLESHSSVTDALERSRIQSNALRLGPLCQSLGALLLELGRTIMTLRMGQAPADALVNAGPAVYVSPTGPNPLMVQMIQPLPLQPGASFGSVPVGTVQPGSGASAASATPNGFAPRNIDIRIRTGSSFIPRREPTASSQPVGQGGGAAAVDPNSDQARMEAGLFAAVPTRRPISIGRTFDPSLGSTMRGFLYPGLARAPGTRASGQHNVNSGQPASADPATQHHRNSYFAFPASGNGENLPDYATMEEALLNDPFDYSTNMRSGLEQLLSVIYPEDYTSDSAAAATPGGSAPPAVPTQTTQEAAQDSQDPASAEGVTDEGVMLSNILRQIMPIISSQNATTSTNEDAQTQTGDENNPDRASSSRHHQPGSQSQQPDSKRQRRG